MNYIQNIIISLWVLVVASAVGMVGVCIIMANDPKMTYVVLFGGIASIFILLMTLCFVGKCITIPNCDIFNESEKRVEPPTRTNTIVPESYKTEYSTIIEIPPETLKEILKRNIEIPVAEPV